MIKKKENMKGAYEYMTLTIPTKMEYIKAVDVISDYKVTSIISTSLDEELNARANEGWELVTVVSITPSIGSKFSTGVPLLVHYFRRAKV